MHKLNETFKLRDTELTLVKRCICFPSFPVTCSPKARSVMETKNGPVFIHLSVLDTKSDPPIFRLTDFGFLILEPHSLADLLSPGLPPRPPHPSPFHPSPFLSAPDKWVLGRSLQSSFGYTAG